MQRTDRSHQRHSLSPGAPFDHYGLGQFIDSYTLSFEHGIQKPNPRLFEFALEQLGVTAAESLMVGDRPNRDGGAVAVGITTLILPPVPNYTLARTGARVAIAPIHVTTSCSLCGPSLTPVVDETALWQIRLNYNQNLLGKLLIVLKRHTEQVASLSAEEWRELHAHVQRSTERLRTAFAPDHFNYAFLQNQDRHVHLHVIPRYASPRLVAGVQFEDPDYPGHYAVPGPVRRVPAEVLDVLAQLLSTEG